MCGFPCALLLYMLEALLRSGCSCHRCRQRLFRVFLPALVNPFWSTDSPSLTVTHLCLCPLCVPVSRSATANTKTQALFVGAGATCCFDPIRTKQAKNHMEHHPTTIP